VQFGGSVFATTDPAPTIVFSPMVSLIIICADGFDVEQKEITFKLVFKSHKRIEIGETISEEHLIYIESSKHFALLLEFRIVAHGISFKSNSIVTFNDNLLN